MTRKKRHLTEIPVIPEKGYNPTQEDMEALELLAQKIIDHNQHVKNPIEAIYVSPKFSLENEALGISFEKSKDLRKRASSVVFAANAHVLLGCIRDGIDLEGVIKHEAGHVESDRLFTDLYKKLLSISLIHKGLDQLEHYPDEKRIDSYIDTEFGSAKKYIEALSKFDKTAPIIIKFAKKSGLLLISPEKLATLPEESPALYRYLKRIERQLPSQEELDVLEGHVANVYSRVFKIKKHFSNALADIFEEKNGYSDLIAILRGERNYPAFEMTPVNEMRMAFLKVELHPSRQLWDDLLRFAHNLSKAEEYRCDEYAVHHSANPDALSKYLQWSAKQRADATGDSLDFISEQEKDYQTHPSTHRRVERMRYIQDHGKPSLDEYLRPAQEKKPANWQSRTKKRSSEPDQSP